MNEIKRAVAGTLLAICASAAPVGRAASPAAAATTQWSTYLRSGPGEAYPVLDELEHDTPVTVAGCQGRWCRISQGATTGYVERDALHLERPPAGVAPKPKSVCFVAGLTSYSAPAPRQFCEDSAAAGR
jgi:uncharacterized protein YraI